MAKAGFDGFQSVSRGKRGPPAFKVKRLQCVGAQSPLGVTQCECGTRGSRGGIVRSWGLLGVLCALLGVLCALQTKPPAATPQ